MSHSLGTRDEDHVDAMNKEPGPPFLLAMEVFLARGIAAQHDSLQLMRMSLGLHAKPSPLPRDRCGEEL